MTKLEIQALLERVLGWPRAMQEEAAEALLGIEAMGAAPYVLSEDERRLRRARPGRRAPRPIRYR